MILMGQRGAKERHDAITHDLIHGAFIAMHGLHHETEHWPQPLVGLFRIETLDQRCRALDIGKHDGDLFTLAFEGGS
jgi:hypothetical protein